MLLSQTQFLIPDFPTMIPLSLYVHMPWCIKKCPYCDFNSHKKPQQWSEKIYIQALLDDFSQDLLQFPCTRSLSSIFIGGGTPSLFSAESYDMLFTGIQALLPFDKNIEITLETNPGSVDHGRFYEYRAAGIQRLSLGVQSFDAHHLNSLGRVHSDIDARRAIETARAAGFQRLNLDIMHGLPNQTIDEALKDLQDALAYQPEHLSWYQLTIEPNTAFYKHPPNLPDEETLESIESHGFDILQAAGLNRYEISAFCRPNQAAQHNINYWLFGDYYGIGAGAHGKITTNDFQVFRTQKQRQPDLYLTKNKSFLAKQPPQKHPQPIDSKNLIFEFMLNTSRLQQAIPLSLFSDRTGLPCTLLSPGLESAAQKKLICLTPEHWQVTELGRRFTNDLQGLFI